MTAKKPRVGGEIDAYCTRCKLDLAHRIVAMVEGLPKKVECLTCGTPRLYRPPRGEKAASSARSRDEAVPPSSAKPRSAIAAKAPRLTIAQRAERDLSVRWESAIAGQPAASFRPYRVSQTFAAGELVRHAKFGDGVVARVIDPSKIEVLFKDGSRTMAQGHAG